MQRRKGIQKNEISSLRRDAEHEPIMICKGAKRASAMQQGEQKTGGTQHNSRISVLMQGAAFMQDTALQ